MTYIVAPGDHEARTLAAHSQVFRRSTRGGTGKGKLFLFLLLFLLKWFPLFLLLPSPPNTGLVLNEVGIFLDIFVVFSKFYLEKDSEPSAFIYMSFSHSRIIARML